MKNLKESFSEVLAMNESSDSYIKSSFARFQYELHNLIFKPSCTV